MEKILIALPVEEHHKTLFEKQAPDARFAYIPVDQVTRDQAQEADIIIGNVAPSLIEGSPNLKWIQLSSVGTEGYLKEGVLPFGCKITNATGAYGLALSEHMLAMLLSLQKKLYLYRDNQQKHSWQDEGCITSIYNSTTLVVGLGDIGNEFAKRMHLLGSYVIGVKRFQTEKPDYIDELFTIDTLNELLPKADFVTLSLPQTADTYHLITKERLMLMKKDAILLNVGRGSAIDTEALLTVLDSGHLAGVGMDVTETEPLPADSPLWDKKNVIITPHVAGGFHLPETLERIVRISASNLQAFTNHRPLRNTIDFSTGYRSLR